MNSPLSKLGGSIVCLPLHIMFVFFIRRFLVFFMLVFYDIHVKVSCVTSIM